MGTQYKDDRPFTDYVHEHLAVPYIYAPLGWATVTYDSNADMNQGVDYSAKDATGRIVKIQERFRDNYYADKYNDFTLRYRRDLNPDPSRHASEFFKIEADYLVYGITNGKKFADARHTLTGFLKYAVIDLAVLMAKIAEGKIIIPSAYKKFSELNANGIMTAAKMPNTDGSSDFVAFDVPMLVKLFATDKIVVAQKGFM